MVNDIVTLQQVNIQHPEIRVGNTWYTWEELDISIEDVFMLPLRVYPKLKFWASDQDGGEHEFEIRDIDEVGKLTT